MRRPAFTLLELILVMGILAALTGISMPAYREYRIRSDLGRAAEHLSQAIGRARLLSASGERDGTWGVHTPTGTLFLGDSYAARTASADELFPIPPNVTVSGLEEVTFSRLLGRPSATGTIILTAPHGYNQRIDITLTREGIPLLTGDKLSICHCAANGGAHNLQIPESAWPGHQGHGDHLGVCTPQEEEEGCGD